MEWTTARARKHKERQLWLLSLAIACIAMSLMFWGVGLLMQHSAQLAPSRPRITTSDTMVIAMAPLPQPPPPAPPPPSEKPQPKRFARTSADQTSAPPEKADFIGDRDTIATSDTLPAAGAPAMPSQKGRDPRRPDDVETTVSIPQDGPLEHDQIASPMPTPPSNAQPSPQVAETMKTAANSANTSDTQPTPNPSPPREQEPKSTDSAPKNVAATDIPTLPGDQIVERPMAEEGLKPQKAEKTPDVAEAKPASPTLPKPTPPQPRTTPKEPGFRGNQEKTKITGSIKRQGRSALNVANTAMGRYHSKLSRAVEAEWHRNCAKYRDFITPGILTIRFVIDPNGSVRSVNVVEMIDAGEVQKGFTLNSIRQAKIPPIPAELKAEIEDDPIEITYNFYF